MHFFCSLEMLQLEFEQTLTANEQAIPINREMRSLIATLQKHNQQIKGENSKLKKKLRDSNLERQRLKNIALSNGLKVCACSGGSVSVSSLDSICTIECCHAAAEKIGNEHSTTATAKLAEHQTSTELGSDDGHKTLEDEDAESKLVIKEQGDSMDEGVESIASSIKKEEDDSTHGTLKKKPPSSPLNAPDSSLDEKCDRLAHSSSHHHHRGRSGQGRGTGGGTTSAHSHGNNKHDRKTDSEIIRDLKAQVKKLSEAQVEYKLLLDTYKSMDKDKR